MKDIDISAAFESFMHEKDEEKIDAKADEIAEALTENIIRKLLGDELIDGYYHEMTKHKG